MAWKHARSDNTLGCSFCHKSMEVVGKLISSPSDSASRAYICNECVAVCNSIIIDDAGLTPEGEPVQEDVQADRQELRTLLDAIPDTDIAAVVRILRALEDRWHRL